jgi:hypothetical protein
VMSISSMINDIIIVVFWKKVMISDSNSRYWTWSGSTRKATHEVHKRYFEASTPACQYTDLADTLTDIYQTRKAREIVHYSAFLKYNLYRTRSGLRRLFLSSLQLMYDC